MNNKKFRIAAMGDVHMHKGGVGVYRDLFASISGTADVLVLCGDLTDHGDEDEAEMLAEELRFCKIPVLGVLGNHDYEAGQSETVKKILTPKAMVLLDDAPHEVGGVGFAGTKGFGGGFDTHMLGLFGETAMKNFVYEAVNEALRLEEALSKIETEKKVVVLHYSPIRETVIGEAEEIFPFLGSSRLVEPIDTFQVNAVFHGHAHHGSALGKTPRGIPVYNASQSVQRRLHEKEPYVRIEI